MAKSINTEVISFRVQVVERQLLSAGAELSGLRESSFVRAAALERARALVDQQTNLVLGGEVDA